MEFYTHSINNTLLLISVCCLDISRYPILVGLGTCWHSNFCERLLPFPLADSSWDDSEYVVLLGGDMVYNSYERLLYENPFIKPQHQFGFTKVVHIIRKL